MPFDPTLPLKVRSPEYHSPLDSYARFLTLREMMDRRQFADQQRQWQSEDRQRMQSLRDLLSTNPNPTWGDIARYDIGTANAYIKSQSEIAKERELALKAKLDAAGKAQEIAATTKETAFNELAGIQAIADPDAKGQAFMEWMGKYQGLGFPRQAGWPMNEQTMEFIGKSGLGPTKWQTLVDARRKAQTEQEDRAHKLAVTQPLEEREKRATTERAEQVLTGTAKPSPAAAPALFDAWYQGWLRQKGMQDTPENRYHATNQWILANRPQFATPGTDVPLPESVEAQRIRMARAGQENKPLSAEAAKTLSISQTLVPELVQLKEAIRTGGRGAIAGIVSRTNPNLSRLADSAADKVGRLRSGGAVNKQEEERFIGQIARATDVLQGQKGVEAAIAAIERYITEAETVEGYVKPANRNPPPGGGKTYEKGSDPMGLGVR